MLNSFVENLYDYWRHFDRFIINDSEGDRLDKRPYRTFNETIEHLTHLIRTVYRHIQEILQEATPVFTGRFLQELKWLLFHCPRRSVILPKNTGSFNCVQVIRQMLIYPPLVIQQPMNKRTGQFKKIQQNPLGSCRYLLR